jgi:hypothetical protein
MKQTAVEWQFEQLFNSFENFNNGKYTFDEYLSNNLNIREQAKEVEKEQIIDANISGMEFIAVDPNHYYNDSEQYYNETFKKK